MPLRVVAKNVNVSGNQNCICHVVCLWQVRGGLSSEVLQQPAWHPLWPQIYHISIWSAQVKFKLLRPFYQYILINTDTAWCLFFCCGRFVQYKATSLEKQHKHELLTEPDLGVTIDLINPDTYRIDPNSKSQVVTFHILQACSKKSWDTVKANFKMECNELQIIGIFLYWIQYKEIIFIAQMFL